MTLARAGRIPRIAALFRKTRAPHIDGATQINERAFGPNSVHRQQVDAFIVQSHPPVCDRLPVCRETWTRGESIMTQWQRSLRLCALALAAPAVLAAQETGKVQGRVTDAQSGQPIAGAQISVNGTRLGNISNAEGYYFINNVPAGLLDIQSQFIGYQTVTVRAQRVLAGQTLTLDFKLVASAIAIAPLEIIGETQPLVPRDQVSSKNIVTGKTVDDLRSTTPRRSSFCSPAWWRADSRASPFAAAGLARKPCSWTVCWSATSTRA